VSHAENCGGMGLEKCRQRAKNFLKSSWFYFAQNSGHPDQPWEMNMHSTPAKMTW